MWISIARSKYLEIQSKIGINNEQIFSYLINKPFPDDSTEDKIRKDLNRTKTDIKYFKSGNWSLSLFNVLKAIALYDDSLGYCIGMNELAACALIVSDCNEVESFNLLRFMYSSSFGLQLREFFINGFPKLRFYTFFVYELIKERLPKIFKILDDYKILNEMWLQNWLQNLYSNLFEFSVGVRLWDCIIALGTDFLINFSLGYVKYFENKIIACRDATEFLEIFKEKNKFKNDKEMIDFREKIIKLSLNFHISPQTYERIEQKWSATCKKEYLARTVTTATNNNMNTNPNEESRANTMKDANDEVEKMKNILIKINEGKEAHVNGETKNEDKKEEKEGNANNNINKVNKEEIKTDLQIIKEESKDEIDRTNMLDTINARFHNEENNKQTEQIISDNVNKENQSESDDSEEIIDNFDDEEEIEKPNESQVLQTLNKMNMNMDMQDEQVPKPIVPKKT